MAYTWPWDNSTPNGAITLAADLDVVIQDLKKAIDERMDDLIGAGNWANNLIQPKQIRPGGAPIFTDPSTSPPAIPNASFPEIDGYVWYATDLRSLNIRDTAAWVPASVAESWDFDADAGVGLQATSLDQESRAVSLHVTGTTDASGLIVVDLLELRSLYTTASIKGINFIATNNTGPTYYFEVDSIAGNAVTFRVFLFTTQAIATTVIVDFYTTLFLVLP